MERMTRCLSLLLVLAMMLGIVPVPAAAAGTQGSCGGDLQWSLDGGVLTISGTGPMDDFLNDIGEQNYLSTSPWADQAKSVVSVVVSPGVTSLGSGAFAYCSNLTSVELPDTLTKIGWGAFYQCKNLVRIVIPESVTRLDSDTFAYCSNLEYVTLPGKIQKIYANTFAFCKKLKQLTLPDS